MQTAPSRPPNLFLRMMHSLFPYPELSQSQSRTTVRSSGSGFTHSTTPDHRQRKDWAVKGERGKISRGTLHSAYVRLSNRLNPILYDTTNLVSPVAVSAYSFLCAEKLAMSKLLGFLHKSGSRHSAIQTDQYHIPHPPESRTYLIRSPEAARKPQQQPASRRISHPLNPTS